MAKSIKQQTGLPFELIFANNCWYNKPLGEGEVFDLRMKAAEHKEEGNKKIRFDAAAILMNTDKKVLATRFRLRLSELVKGKAEPLIAQTEDGRFDEQRKAFTFPRFEFTSDMSTSTTPVHQKNFLLEILEMDPKKPGVSKQFGRTQFCLGDCLKKGATGKIGLFMLGEKNDRKGTFEITQCTARRFYTFLDLQLRNQLNIVPIVGIDFSLANLTFDGVRPLIHTLNSAFQNDYVDALSAICAAYKQHS